MISATEELRSPCRACGLADEDKNGPACLQCAPRLNYVRALGGHLPGDGTPENTAEIAGDLRANPDLMRVGNKRYQPWTEKESEFVRAHVLDMSDEEMAAVLGRSAATVQRHRSRYRIIRRVPGASRLKGDIPTTKICKGCGKSKALSEFPKTPQNRDGRGGKCKQCKNEYLRNWYADNLGKPAPPDDAPPSREREREIPVGRQFQRLLPLRFAETR